MTNEEKRIKIAEACGWKKCYAPGAIGLLVGIAPESYAKKNDPKHYLIDERKDWYELPDYLSDLNACHEMEKALTDAQWDDYSEFLRVLSPWMGGQIAKIERRHIGATAAGRAEAFGLTLNLWS